MKSLSKFLFLLLILFSTFAFSAFEFEDETIKWSEVIKDPEYQALSPAEKKQVQDRYWTNVISKDPEFQTLSPSEKIQLQNRFFKPKWSEVIEDPEYQALNPVEKKQVQDRYWTNVISKDPDYQALSPTEKKQVYDRFFNKPKKRVFIQISLICVTIVVTIGFLIWLLIKKKQFIINQLWWVVRFFTMQRVITIIVSTLLFWTALEEHPYGHYQILRWIVCMVGIYTIWLTLECKRTIWMGIFIAIVILFNPVLPIHLTYQAWQPIDVVTGSLFLVSTFFVRSSDHKLKKIEIALIAVIIALSLAMVGVQTWKEKEKIPPLDIPNFDWSKRWKEEEPWYEEKQWYEEPMYKWK